VERISSRLLAPILSFLFSKVWLYLDALIERFDGFVALTIATKNIAFVFPSQGIVGMGSGERARGFKEKSKAPEGSPLNFPHSDRAYSCGR
jgi:hypothetical protein